MSNNLVKNVVTLSKKIEALNLLISLLNDPKTFYSWDFSATCNIGSLFQVLFDLNHHYQYMFRLVSDHVKKFYGIGVAMSYTSYIELSNDYLKNSVYQPVKDAICPITKLPVSILTEKLIEYGFDENDLLNLEMLSNPTYNYDNLQYNKQSDVIIYVQRWVDDLKNQLQHLNTVNSSNRVNNLVQTVSVTG